MLLYVFQSNDSALISRFLLTWVPMVIIAIAFHEAGHAFSALWLGDRTAQGEGRCTLNPIKHFDPLGFLMVLFGPIGWGRPVPVNPYNLRKPERDSMLTAAAGPGVNFVLAGVSAIGVAAMREAFPDIFRYSYEGILLPTSEARWPWIVFAFFQAGVVLNLGLACFNLVPLFPLDGEKVLGGLLPRGARDALEAFRPHAPLALMMILMVGWMNPSLNIIWWVISAIGYPFSYALTGESLSSNWGAFQVLLFQT